MSSEARINGKEKQKVFETIMKSPGMDEKCKISFNLSRQNVLLLGRLIEKSLLEKDGAFKDEIIDVLPSESIEEFKAIHTEILEKARLTDFYKSLKQL